MSKTSNTHFLFLISLLKYSIILLSLIPLPKVNPSTEINLIVKGYTGNGANWPIFIGHSFENPKKVIINESDTSEHRIWWGMEKGKTYNITLT